MLGPGDIETVMSAGILFDNPPRRDAAERFLAEPGHHLVVAMEDGVAVGFVSGVETVHPDKGVEMFLYELSVAESHWRRGIGRALVERLADIARAAGCYGMWVGTDDGNPAALATYARAGGVRDSEPTVVLTWDFSTA